MLGTIGAYASTTDPIQVVNNLSDFIFGLVKANGFMTVAGGIVITLAKEILILITGT